MLWLRPTKPPPFFTLQREHTKRGPEFPGRAVLQVDGFNGTCRTRSWTSRRARREGDGVPASPPNGLKAVSVISLRGCRAVRTACCRIGARGQGFSLQQRRNGLVQIASGDASGGHNSIAVDQKHRGNRNDSIIPCQGAFRSTCFPQALPADSLLTQVGGQSIVVGVQIDSQDFKALFAVFLIDLIDRRKFFSERL